MIFESRISGRVHGWRPCHKAGQMHGTTILGTCLLVLRDELLFKLMRAKIGRSADQYRQSPPRAAVQSTVGGMPRRY